MGMSQRDNNHDNPTIEQTTFQQKVTKRSLIQREIPALRSVRFALYSAMLHYFLWLG